MPLFSIKTGVALKLRATNFSSEKELQRVVERNLESFLDIFFLQSEFYTTSGGRIDTLGVDRAGSPVIIEYKKSRNDTVINQSLSYLKWLKSQNAGFFENMMRDKLRADVVDQIKLDWLSPRVICIAESYSMHDIDTAEIVPLRIELFRYQLYESEILHLEPVHVTETAAAKISARSVKQLAPKPKEINTVSVDNHLARGTPQTVKLFEVLREHILAWDEAIIERATKPYIAYRLTKNFAEVHIGKQKIRIHLRSADYHDPLSLVNRHPETHNWTLDRFIDLVDESQIEYAASIIEKSYETVK